MKFNYSDIIKNQPTLNLGMIGHVASGKSTLTRQITGTKTQKFSSEKERNITIEIGYANAKIYLDKNGKYHTTSSNTNELLDDDGEKMQLIKHISIVDCPGHESFMANMINGSAVMDACVLVIATNEQIPQPQTYEHLQAVENIDIDNYIVLQNKMDLIKKSQLSNKLDDIKKFLKDTKAEKSEIIPSSVQIGVNVNQVIKSIINLPNLERQVNEDPKMIIIRSFDINKLNIPYTKLQGGVVGGSLISGYLKKNDIIELRPGFIIKDKDVYKFKPIISKITSLQSDTRKLDFAFPGGLIGLGLQIDPSLTKNNGMVGQILGKIGSLPPVYHALKLKYNLIKRYDNLKVTFAKNEELLICVNSMRITGTIEYLKKKKKNFRIFLEKPICLSKNQKISIFKNINNNWKLVAISKLIAGLECEIVSDKEYNKYKKEQINEEIEIVYDIPEVKFKNATYEENLMNIKFRDNNNFKLNIVPPILSYKYPITVFKNYEKYLKSLDLRTDDIIKNINYSNLINNFIKKELSCEIEMNGSKQLCLRGKFKGSQIEKITVKFIKTYLNCFSCSSPRTFLFKKDKINQKKCLSCSSVSSCKLVK